jgi:hypothetical protein
VAAAALAALGAGASGQTFIGQNFSASRYQTDTNRFLPDTDGAVGVDYFVEHINGRYSVYRKSDGARVSSTTQDAFWTGAGAPPSGIRAFDPRVLYDPYAQRWYALSIDNFLGNGITGANSFLLAVSNSSDPTAGWKAMKIDSDSNDSHFADFPMLGYNKDAVVLTANMYSVATQTTGQSTTVVVVPKADLLAANPTVANATRFEEMSVNDVGFTLQPAVDMDNGSLSLPLLSAYNNFRIKRSSVVGTAVSPGIGITGGYVQVNNTAPPDVDQPGPAANVSISQLGIRFYQNAVLSDGELWGVHAVDVGGRAGLHWYRINATTNTLIQSGYISDPSLAFFVPSIAVNKFGDVVIGMSGAAPETPTSAGTFISGYAVVGKTIGGITSFQTPTQTMPGAASYAVFDAGGRNRWGDYSATTNDPADPSIFWTIQEYAAEQDIWGTQVTEIILPRDGEVRWKNPASGDFDVNSNWYGDAAPTPASHVIFSRAADPAGVSYIVNVPSNATFDRLSVRQGKVALNLNGAILSATNNSSTAPSITVGEFAGAPTLNVIDGTLAGVHATLATAPNSAATVNLNLAHLQLQGNLSVGGTDSASGGVATLNIDASSSLAVAQTLHVWEHGVVNFNDGTMSANALIVNGGQVALTGGSTKVLRVKSVQTSNGGQIDLGSNAMIVDYDPADLSPLISIRNQIASAYSGGNWSGGGIATTGGGPHRLGYAEASSLGTIPEVFGDVDDTAVLVLSTLPGDLNLDRAVTISDFVDLASHFGSSGNWREGDMNYDGLITISDFIDLASNFNTTYSGSVLPLHPADAALLVEFAHDKGLPIPEPASIFMLLVMLLLGCQKRICSQCRRSPA